SRDLHPQWRHAEARRGGGHLYLQALRLIGGKAMKPIIAASLLMLCLSACGGPSDEDVLTPEKIRASESAPELPDIQLSENPEPPPAPALPDQPALNETDNAMMENAVEEDELAPLAEGSIPAAFRDQWGQVPEDCAPGGGAGSGLVTRGKGWFSADFL